MTDVQLIDRLDKLEKLVGEINLVAVSDRSDGGKLSIIRALLRADIIDSQPPNVLTQHEDDCPCSTEQHDKECRNCECSYGSDAFWRQL